MRQVLDYASAAPPRAQYDAGAIRRLFALDLAHHCFAVRPHEWAKFYEPQITRGFVHYLTEGGADRQLGRALAFYRAACRCAGRRIVQAGADRIKDFEVAAEEATTMKRGAGRKRIERGKIDILVDFELDDGVRAGAALEAKFDHTLSRGQLGKYAAHLIDKRQWSYERSPLILVGRYTTPPDDGRWDSTNWWRFMLWFERELAEPDDDPEFQRFRRTLWETAYA
ncbi:hypothetical protein Q9Q95_21005 [Sphingomonas sp. DG1-23]|uniref:hypothetical protein n=1 Tax=Sphingomonas sp. DG1-23 TaxID=3068316 RepID=UPI00273F3C76|nr:hypothetical protein [Sphingomonas sp. DG1-23]MDP5281418.1 hypothetical protein [Sphingomonas sp. DG1-23]